MFSLPGIDTIVIRFRKSAVELVVYSGAQPLAVTLAGDYRSSGGKTISGYWTGRRSLCSRSEIIPILTGDFQVCPCSGLKPGSLPWPGANKLAGCQLPIAKCIPNLPPLRSVIINII